jgi:hypothetical protein
MKYAALIYINPGSYEGLADSEQQTVSGEYLAVARDARCVEGAQLQPVTTATTVRVQGGRTLTTDGPFADTKEVLGGYFVFDAGNLDEAIELASRVPATWMGGAVEVRPLVENQPA